MRVAITGAGGRLGRALVAALGEAPFCGPLRLLAWSRPDYDLDDPVAAARVVGRDRPDVVVHAAAWTDVDGCARDPERAMRRNAIAVAELAEACAVASVDLVLASTNEVFGGHRTDGVGYAAGDRPEPANPYGASKHAGETAAPAEFLRHGGVVTPGAGLAQGVPQLAIVRSSWLFGPPGNDFPTKILAAAQRALDAGEPLRVVGDEIGCPTYAPDLAQAITEIIGTGSFAGIHHIVNGGRASRAGWARTVLAAAGAAPPIEEIALQDWKRLSAVPAWAVLAPTPLPSGVPLRSWEAAHAEYLPILLRGRATAARR